MKRIISLSFLLPIILISCDKISNPIPEGNGAINWDLYPDNPSNYPYNFSDPGSNWTSNTNPERNILLEDYTGHKCTYCPAAATIAQNLENTNPDRIIVATIHASPDGAFQEVDSEFLTDFTTTAGTDYTEEMLTWFGNPAGSINRLEGGIQNGVWYTSSNWTNKVNDELSSAPLLANIQVQTNYYGQTNGLFIHTETEFKSNLTSDYHLIIYLIRDAVIAPQKLSNGTTEEEYHHHSVLTDNINGTWGTPISSGGVSAEDKFYNDFSYELQDPATDSTFEITNLSLITFLCDRNSFEVIQVVKTELP